MSKLALLGGNKVRNKPFITGVANIGTEERKRVNTVLDSGILSGFIAKAGEAFLGGQQVKAFESLVREYFSVPHAISVNSATAGLHTSLMACGLGPGDEVIVTPYTMSASATAIVMCGGIPVFADIEENTYGLDADDVKRRITPRTRAIVVVHLFGRAANMGPLLQLAAKHNLPIIEDCAQAPGATWKGKFVGTLGSAGVFSLNQHKAITSGEGGFVITQDDRLALRMQLIRNHGEVIADDMNIEDVTNLIGFNYRMTELEAAVAFGQFRRLDELNKQRIALASHLTQRLSGFPGLTLPEVPEGDLHVYFVYPIRVDAQAFGISRNLLTKALQAEGIPVGDGYVRPIYREPMYRKKTAWGKKGFPFTETQSFNYENRRCPVTERMHEKELLMTPVCCAPQTEEDINDVAEAFEKIYAARHEILDSETIAKEQKHLR